MDTPLNRVVSCYTSSMQYDTIILPGGGLNSDGSLRPEVLPRLEKAAELYKAGSTQSIVVCGSHSYKYAEKVQVTEAHAYANHLNSLGVPNENIYLEEDSQESLGNILFAKMNFLMQHNWKNILVIPTYNQSTERISYIVKKVLGPEYQREIMRVGENKNPANVEREAKAYKLTTDINDVYADGDHEAIHKGLLETHPAYGGTKWTLEELSNEMKPKS